MSSQVQNTPIVAGPDPQPVLNFFSRRRIAISLIGFTSLVLFNVVVRRTVPHNPFDLSDPVSAIALLLVLTGLAIRSWSAGTLNKSRELTTHGPYALTRNPLYIGSFLMMLAFCIVCRDWLTMAFIAGPMSALYYLQIRFEERRLERMFPDQWRAYCQTTPRILPRRLSPTMFTGWKKWEWTRNREYRAILATGIGWVAIFGWHCLSLRIW